MGNSFKGPRTDPLTVKNDKPRKTSNPSEYLNIISDKSISEVNEFEMDIESVSGKQSTLLNLEVERNSYLKHIKNLRLAHKIQLKNEKFLTMTKLEEIIQEKLVAYEECLTRVIRRVLNHVHFLKGKIEDQNAYIKKLSGFIKKYELNMLYSVIQDGDCAFEPIFYSTVM